MQFGRIDLFMPNELSDSFRNCQLPFVLFNRREMRDMRGTLVMGTTALAVMQVLFMAAAVVASARMIEREGIPHDASLSFMAVGRNLRVDAPPGYTGMLDHVPREPDPVAVLAQALQDGTFGRAAYAADGGFDPAAVPLDRFEDDCGPQALPVAEPSTLLLLVSAVTGPAATLRRYGEWGGHA